MLRVGLIDKQQPDIMHAGVKHQQGTLHADDEAYPPIWVGGGRLPRASGMHHRMCILCAASRFVCGYVGTPVDLLHIHARHLIEALGADLACAAHCGIAHHAVLSCAVMLLLL